MRLLFSISGFMLFILLAIGFGLSTLQHLYEAPAHRAQDQFLVITDGMGANMIARKLENDGLIDHRYMFMLATRYEGVENGLKAGEYLIEKDQSLKEILFEIADGDVYLRQFTIPEGRTSYEIVQELNKIENMSGEITEIPAEGSLLPETYRYSYQEARTAQIAKMQSAMQETLQDAWDNRQEGLPFNSMEEALIMASIVEKETGLDGERAKVAGVFINRLKIGMPLQSDPTVIYAITKGQEPLGRPLYRSDWKVDSPYNTYQIAGLPPRPICNPGKEAIHATLNPQNHDYYYFVANGTGGHSFASTLSEHNRNVAAWRKIRDAQ